MLMYSYNTENKTFNALNLISFKDFLINTVYKKNIYKISLKKLCLRILAFNFNCQGHF